MRLYSESDRVFLLRCWRENNDLDNSRAHWRFSLEEVSPQRGRRGFVALAELLAFLRREFEEAHPPAGAPPREVEHTDASES